jgi:hypothetical protein
VGNDIEAVKALPASEQWGIGSLGLIGLFGEVMVYMAISVKMPPLPA